MPVMRYSGARSRTGAGASRAPSMSRDATREMGEVGAGAGFVVECPCGVSAIGVGGAGGERGGAVGLGGQHAVGSPDHTG